MLKAGIGGLLGQVLGFVLLLAMILGGWTLVYVIGGDSLPRAAANGDMVGVRLLLALGYNPDRRDEAGASALFLAASRDHSWTARRLVHAGASATSALEEAVGQHDEAAVRMLLALGAEVAGSSGGLPPLALAAGAGDAGMTELLLASGASPVAGSDGDTPLHKVIAARAKPVHTPHGQRKFDANYPETVRLLATNGVAIDARDTAGFTALQRAAETDDLEMAQLLISLGADIRAKSADGRSVFRIAAGAGSADICALLKSEAARRRNPNGGGENDENEE